MPKTLLGVEGLKAPGTPESPCPWFSDWFGKDARGQDEDPLKFLATWEEVEMWICVCARAGIAASWWKGRDEEQHARWHEVFTKSLDRWGERHG